jgi:uracil-DNA glycosylase
MRTVDPGHGFETWRTVARRLLQEAVPPADVIWDGNALPCLFEEPAAYIVTSKKLAVPAAFMNLAKEVACHCDPERWALLYRLLWRVTRGGERTLIEISSDPEVSKAMRMAKSVRREIHKMHAFVRFRKSGEDADGRERFVAWFEPDHHIIRLGTPFFVKRFANMDWAIFTPKGCAHWVAGVLKFSPGCAADPCDDPDAIEEIWRIYYKSIFNPARLKVKMMQTEMPKRYWKNLPEADLIESLVAESRMRVDDMLAQAPREVRPILKNAYLEKLRDLDRT